MSAFLKCEVCGKRASYAFLEKGLVKHICIKCNDVVCILTETFPLLQIIKGGKFKGGQNG